MGFPTDARATEARLVGEKRQLIGGFGAAGRLARAPHRRLQHWGGPNCGTSAGGGVLGLKHDCPDLWTSAMYATQLRPGSAEGVSSIGSAEGNGRRPLATGAGLRPDSPADAAVAGKAPNGRQRTWVAGRHGASAVLRVRPVTARRLRPLPRCFPALRVFRRGTCPAPSRGLSSIEERLAHCFGSHVAAGDRGISPLGTGDSR